MGEVIFLNGREWGANMPGKKTEGNIPHVLFSIIVPVYNVAPYLEQCVHSVLNQSERSLELILVDDGATDESGRLCDGLAAQDDRVRVVHQENRGLSAARNRGIPMATGDYVMFLDSDDYWQDLQVLEKVRKRLELSKAQVLSFNFWKVTENSVSKPYFSTQAAMPLNTQDSLGFQMANEIWIACAWNKVLRRELLTGGRLYFREGITAEDVDWCLRLALEADRFDYIPDVLVCYRQRATSISGSTSVEKTRMLLENIDYCLTLVAGADREEVVKPYIAYQVGTALAHLAALPPVAEREDLIRRTEPMVKLLGWSKNRKIRCLRLATSLGGLKFTLWLLRFRGKL